MPERADLPGLGRFGHDLALLAASFGGALLLSRECSLDRIPRLRRHRNAFEIQLSAETLDGFLPRHEERPANLQTRRIDSAHAQAVIHGIRILLAPKRHDQAMHNARLNRSADVLAMAQDAQLMRAEQPLGTNSPRRKPPGRDQEEPADHLHDQFRRMTHSNCQIIGKQHSVLFGGQRTMDIPPNTARAIQVGSTCQRKQQTTHSTPTSSVAP